MDGRQAERSGKFASHGNHITDLSPLVQQKIEERRKAKTDRLYLANEVLGYDFLPETHAELFEQYPQFKSDVPWASQFPVRDVLVLWPRGHFKTTAVMVVIV